jgi:hypothetical protein
MILKTIIFFILAIVNGLSYKNIPVRMEARRAEIKKKYRATTNFTFTEAAFKKYLKGLLIGTRLIIVVFYIGQCIILYYI